MSRFKRTLPYVAGSLIVSLQIASVLTATIPLDVSAQSLTTSTSFFRVCRNRGEERRSQRLVRAGRNPICSPRTSSSSSSSSVSTLKPCTTLGSYSRAIILRGRRLPMPCNPDTSIFAPGRSSSSSSSSSTGMSSSSSSIWSGQLDTMDTTIRSQLLLLGEVSPVIGATKLFIEEEPLHVTSISVTLNNGSSTIQSLMVYNDDKQYLGRATLDPTVAGNRTYKLTIPTNVFVVDKRDERRLYFRAQLSSRDAGGESNLDVQIDTVTIQGNGEWSSRKYTKQSSGTDTFPAFATARSTVTKVTNTMQPEGALVVGSNQLIGSFKFEGRKTDASAKIELQTLQFTIEQTGGVSLSNVRIGVPGLPDRYSCPNSSSLVTCSNIPDTFGSLTDEAKTITVYADITANDPQHASLRLTLNDPGSAFGAGALSFSDGTNTFNWIGLDAPIVQGTRWKY